VSTEIDDDAVTATPPQKFTALSRMFHWLTAILIFAALLIGFTMVNWLGGYVTLRVIHMSIGALILVVVVLRVVNRLRHHPPAWPPTIGRLEGKAVIWSERAMYALLLAQPLVGWAMVSASGTPVRVFSALHLPPIAPFDIDVYAVLREAHSVMAYLLVLVVAAHISTVLAHSIVLRDGMLRRMTLHIGRRYVTASTAAASPTDQAERAPRNSHGPVIG
jgi:cytochrome b561